MYNVKEREKLYKKSNKCMSLGYVDSVKRYYLWDPTICKIIVSINVIFVDNELKIEVNDSIFNEIMTPIIVQIEKS